MFRRCSRQTSALQLKQDGVNAAADIESNANAKWTAMLQTIPLSCHAQPSSFLARKPQTYICCLLTNLNLQEMQQKRIYLQLIQLLQTLPDSQVPQWKDIWPAKVKHRKHVNGPSPCKHSIAFKQATLMLKLACLATCTLPSHIAMPSSKRKEKATPFGVNLMRSPVLYWAAQLPCHPSFAATVIICLLIPERQVYKFACVQV